MTRHAALSTARAALYRATETPSSMLRAQSLWRARDALHAAGFRRWADIAEAAAQSIGGGDSDVRRLMLDIEQKIVNRKDRTA